MSVAQVFPADLYASQRFARLGMIPDVDPNVPQQVPYVSPGYACQGWSKCLIGQSNATMPACPDNYTCECPHPELHMWSCWAQLSPASTATSNAISRLFQQKHLVLPACHADTAAVALSIMLMGWCQGHDATFTLCLNSDSSAQHSLCQQAVAGNGLAHPCSVCNNRSLVHQPSDKS